MRLYVYLLEGKDLPVKDSYVKLQVGKHRSESRVLKNADQNPFWNEEFVFRVHDLDDEIVVSVYDDSNISSSNNDGHRDHKHLRSLFSVVHLHNHGEVVGRVRIPVSCVASEENMYLPATWFSLERPNDKNVDKDHCGKLCLALSLHERGQKASSGQIMSAQSNSESDDGIPLTFATPSRKKLEVKPWMKTITTRIEKLFNKKAETSKDDHISDPSTPSEYKDCAEEPLTSSGFQELLEIMESKNENQETPENLQGGVLLDQTYVVSPKDLNMVIFAPDSEFQRELYELQGTTDVQEQPWISKSEEGTLCLARVVTYIKAATKLVKATKAIEEQKYVKANGSEFAVFVSVSTPDVPYGSSFKVELLYKIISGFESSSGDAETARLVVSWAVNFTQSTMMKGLIENGVRQGLKDSFEQFSDLLCKRFEVVEDEDKSDKDHMLEMIRTEQNSDSESAIHYFFNFTMVSTVFMLVYVVIHIILCKQKKTQGLKFQGLDLPDSFGELITSGLLAIQLERVYYMISHFIEAKQHRGSNHGVKAQGDGWILTVALIKGTNIASLSANEIPDPYVVFTCNGKTRTSSVKLQTLDPQWNEILEFDAVDDPPSVLDVEVFDFVGPFDQGSSLGHAEINFLKHTAEELADLWVTLEGKLARSSQSKLHLRIFLDNNNGVETIKDYLSNIEREVGKKLNLCSPHRNSNFQKTFGLPSDEFLITDFSCSLKRKMPIQGRIFLSARIVGFYSNLFGHKTRFFFLWEDIEDIHVLPPSISTVGSPALVIILHKGRGLDAKHGAKLLDDEGRLHFHFHSFVSFNAASRTTMALWRTRTLVESEQEDQDEIVEEQLQDDEKDCPVEDTKSYLIVEDVNMNKVYSAELPVNMESLMKMFDGEDFEHTVMSKSGCLNYATNTWELVAPDVQERRISYKFSRRVSIFGGGATCTQQKTPLPNDSGWMVNEVMTLHSLPICDHFRIQFRYVIENFSFAHNSCKCDIYIGVVWLKNVHFEAIATKNIIGKYTHRLEEIFKLAEREILSTTR